MMKEILKEELMIDAKLDMVAGGNEHSFNTEGDMIIDTTVEYNSTLRWIQAVKRKSKS